MSTTLVAIGIFLLFNLVAIASVAFSHYKKWRIDLTQYRHYTATVFNICGVVYALFLGFIIWDVWERYYDMKKLVHEEAAALTNLARDVTVLPEQGEEGVQGAIRAYLSEMAHIDWRELEHKSNLSRRDALVNKIWEAYYAYSPTTPEETIWYTAGIEQLNHFSQARSNRLFEGESTVGPLRWALLIFGGLVLISIPCFFRVEYFTFKLILTLFLANIVAFMLFITYSLDHPFSGYRRIDSYPFQYALKVIQPW
ncbi:MAG: DUF4239 domain-containing protein [Parachlamydiales bacterium]